jgi:hypothetical protein
MPIFHLYQPACTRKLELLDFGCGTGNRPCQRILAGYSLMLAASPIMNLLLVLGLGFFFGLAFEEFYARDGQARPGGIRSFPLLSLGGALLYRRDTWLGI